MKDKNSKIGKRPSQKMFGSPDRVDDLEVSKELTRSISAPRESSFQVLKSFLGMITSEVFQLWSIFSRFGESFPSYSSLKRGYFRPS
jgi:hypothetical protein